MGCPMAAAPAWIPGQHSYISHSSGLQHSPLSLGPAACCGVDTLHNTPGPAPLPCRGCLAASCWEAEQQPAGCWQRGEDAPFPPLPLAGHQRRWQDQEGSTRTYSRLLVKVALEGQCWGKEDCPTVGMKKLRLSCFSKTVGLHPRGAGATMSCPGGAWGKSSRNKPQVRPDGKVGHSYQSCLLWAGLVLQCFPEEKHPQRLFPMAGSKPFLIPQQGGRGRKLWRSHKDHYMQGPSTELNIATISALQR